MDLESLKQRLVTGDAGGVTALAAQALEAGHPAPSILNQALIPGSSSAGVTQAFADRIGADGFGRDATAAVSLARRLLGHSPA